jgi:hypothetical protein
VLKSTRASTRTHAARPPDELAAGCTDTAVLYGRCDPGSAVSTRGPKAGQRLAAMRRVLSHAGGAVLTFAQQQQQAAGSSSLSLHATCTTDRY